MLLAIDPGRDNGWALYDSAGVLVDVGFRLQALPEAGQYTLTRVVIEDQIIAPYTPSARSILTLAKDARAWGLAAAKAGVPEIEYVVPRLWKGGSIPKPVDHARTVQRLRWEERVLLASKIGAAGPACSELLGAKPRNRREAILDAVGIGLYAVGRKRGGQ